MTEELPKLEPILLRYRAHPEWQGELRNYLWDYYTDFHYPWSWYKKYRHHGQYNGKKPKWRKWRKQKRRFKDRQNSSLNLGSFASDHLIY